MRPGRAACVRVHTRVCQWHAGQAYRFRSWFPGNRGPTALVPEVLHCSALGEFIFLSGKNAGRNFSVPVRMYQNLKYRCVWVARSVKHLTSAQVMNSGSWR